MSVTRHTRVTSEKVEDGTLDTVDFADDSVTDAKMADDAILLE